MQKYSMIDECKASLKVFAFITIFLFSVSLVQAATRFSVSSGNWNSTSTWSATSGGPAGASVPGKKDNAIIERGFIITVNTSNIICKTIKIGSANGTGELIIAGGTNQLTVLSLTTVNTNGTFNLSNGKAILAGLTSSGTVNISGGILINDIADIAITAGIFTQSGGTIQGTANPPSKSIKFNGGTGIQSGGTMYVRDFILASGISFTQNENTSAALIKIAHDYANSGTFNSTAGKVQWTGGVSASAVSNLSGINNFFNVELLGNQLLFAGTSGSFNVAGNWTFSNTNTTISTKVTTVTFKGIAAQNIGGTASTTFNNLVINNPNAAVSLSASINMAGVLTVKAGSILNLSAFTLGSTTKPTSLVMETGTTGSVITGSGILSLGGNVTVSATSGSSGASITTPVALNAARIFNVADEGTTATDLTISGIISGAASNLTKTGAGTMVLSGMNSYTGVTSVNAGILSISSINNGGVAGNLGQSGNAASNLVLNGGTLQYTGASASTDRAFTLTSGITSIIDITTNVLTISGSSVNTTGSLTKTGPGTLILAGTNAYTGLTMVTAGTLGYGISNALSTGAVTIDGATAIFDISNFSDVVGAVTLDNSGRINGTTGVLTSAASFELKNGSVSAILGGTGIPLNKTTTGTVTLSGSNTYTGVTTVNSGILSISSINNGGVAGNLGQASNAASNLVLNGGTLQYTGASASTNRAFTLTSGITSTIDITTNALTISGASANTSGSLTKAGSGTLVLSGTNQYTGLTTVNAGTLRYGTVNALSTGAVTIDGATAILDVSNFSDAVGVVTLDNLGQITGTTGVLTSTASFELKNGSVSAILGGAGIPLNKTAIGTVTLSGSNTYTGVTTITAGSLILGASGVIPDTGPMALNGGTLKTGATTGYNETAGTLALSASSTIALGTGIHTLAFAASNGIVWSGGKFLTITGWTGNYATGVSTAGKIIVGTTSGGLTPAQLLQIGFFDGTKTYPAAITSSGEVVPYTPPVPSNLSYQSPSIFTINFAIQPLYPTVTSAIISFSVTPALPAGLTLDTSSGIISGTPTVSQSPDDYLVTATNVSGSTSSIVSIGMGTTLVTGGSGNWSSTTPNFPWPGGIPPTALENVIIAANHTVTVDGTFSCASLRIGSNNNTAALTFSGVLPQLTVTGKINIGDPSGIERRGQITFTSDAALVAGTFTLGKNTDGGTSVCKVDMTSGGILRTGSLEIGTGGTGNPEWIPGAGTVEISGNNTLPATAVTSFNNLLITAGTTTTGSVITSVSGALTVKGGATLSLAHTVGPVTSLLLYCGDAGSSVNGSGTLLLGGNVTVSKAGTGNTPAALSAPVSTGAANRTFAVADDGTLATDLTLSGIISGSGGINKEGAGTMLLSGTNTYTGVTSINAGILSVASVTNGGIASHLGQAANAAANLVLGGGTLQYAGALSSTDRAFTLTPGTTSVIDITSGTLAISGSSAGTTGSLTKTGSGSLILQGTNMYSGATTVTAGVLNIRNTQGTGTTAGGVSVSSGATLELQGGITVGAEALNLAGNLINVSGDNTWGGVLTISSGSAIISSSANKLAFSNSVTLGANQLRLQGSSTSNNTLNGIISGTGSISKDGDGTWALSGANTFTGGVSLLKGSLNINHAQALGTAAGTFFIGGAGNPVTIDNTSGSPVTIISGNPIVWNNDFTFSGTNSLNLGTGSISMTASRQVTIVANALTMGGVISAGSLTITKAGAGELGFGSNTVTLNGINLNEGSLVSTSGNLNVSGLFSNTGNFVHNSGTVNFTGNAGQIIPAADYYNITSSNSGSRTLSSSGSIGIAGIFTPGSNAYTIDGSTVNFNGSGNQTIPSFIFNDLSLSTAGIKSIPPTGIVTVTGIMTNNLAADMFVLKSNSSATASLLHTTASVDGTVERSINNTDWADWKDGWHFLSSPVDEQFISPGFTVAPEATGPYDFYCWNEPKNVWVSYKNTVTAPTWSTANTIENTIPDNDPASFLVGKGYMTAYDEAGIKLFSGHLNVDDVAISGLTITGNTQTNRSWHLLGNPFSCALNWDASPAWNLNKISGVAKIWNEASQSYSDLTSSPSSVIPATNGFMVQVALGTGSLTLPALKRIHSAQAFFKMGVPGVKLIAHINGSANAQESTVYFSPDATAGFDTMYDGEFLAGYAPQFYSLAGTEKLSTNTLPEMTSELIIPFGFVKNEFSDFSISLAENLPGSILYLEDKKTNTFHNLTANPVYSFTSSEGDQANRFYLHFSGLGFTEPEVKETFRISTGDGAISITTEKPVNAEIWVTNTLGQVIMRSHTNGNNLTTLNSASLKNGLYVVSLVGNNTKVSQKMVINK